MGWAQMHGAAAYHLADVIFTDGLVWIDLD
jgi:hypothetical protein